MDRAVYERWVAGMTWASASLREQLINTGVRLVRHGHDVAVQMAVAALPRRVFAGVLDLINGLRGPPDNTAPARSPPLLTSVSSSVAAGSERLNFRTNGTKGVCARQCLRNRSKGSAAPAVQACLRADHALTLK